jgi:hypothetical protein
VSFRTGLDRHLAVPVVAVLASLVGALSLGGSTTQFTVSTGSAQAKAAVAGDGRGGAERFAAGGPSMQAALSIAQSHWGAVPCKGQFEVTWELLDRNTNATASWRNPTDAWNNTAENFDCQIRFNTVAEYDWEKFCSVMAHEVGHLVGQQHSGDPRDLMSPMYNQPLAACSTTPDPAAAPVTAVAATEPVVAKRRQSSPSAKRKIAARKAAKRKAARRKQARLLARRAKARTAARRSKAAARTTARAATAGRTFTSAH